MLLERAKIIVHSAIRGLNIIIQGIEGYLPSEYEDELNRVVQNLTKITTMDNDTEMVSFFVKGELKMRALVGYMVSHLSGHFTVIPLTENFWKVYTKKELFPVIKEKLKGSDENVHNKSLAES